MDIWNVDICSQYRKRHPCYACLCYVQKWLFHYYEGKKYCNRKDGVITGKSMCTSKFLKFIPTSMQSRCNMHNRKTWICFLYFLAKCCIVKNYFSRKPVMSSENVTCTSEMSSEAHLLADCSEGGKCQPNILPGLDTIRMAGSHSLSSSVVDIDELSVLSTSLVPSTEPCQSHFSADSSDSTNIATQRVVECAVSFNSIVPFRGLYRYCVCV